MSIADLDDDLAFDVRLPSHLRRQSASHFTPVEVARHVATLLAPRGGQLVLDVGAGAGKFCLVAAELCPSVTFVGIEQRGYLVDVAMRLAVEAGRSNVRFGHANVFDVDWSSFDAFYFFNPFSEHLLQGAVALDQTIELGRAHFDRYIAAALERLARARVGTHVITYHGLGASLPTSYELVGLERVGTDNVELWERIAVS